MEQTTALATREGTAVHQYVGPKTWGEMRTYANSLLQSGFLPKSIGTPEKAIAILQVARELNLNPMEAFKGVYVIEGVPSVAPRLKLACVQRSGLLEDYQVREGDGWAECTMRRRGLKAPFTFRYTLDEAKGAGLVGKDNWRKWPRAMMRWRAIGIVVELLFSDVTGGHYTPDELGAVTDEEGVPVEQQDAPHRSSVEVAEEARARAHRFHELKRKAVESGRSEADVIAFFTARGARRTSEISDALMDEWDRDNAPLQSDVVEAEFRTDDTPDVWQAEADRIEREEQR